MMPLAATADPWYLCAYDIAAVPADVADDSD